ncbi:MAG: DNA-protecting protein DprA, partial [Candidatus Levybacteria bacterium]|nr:DNA-protecting protein DprA [Candidatus Levybacteria bacterium]
MDSKRSAQVTAENSFPVFPLDCGLLRPQLASKTRSQKFRNTFKVQLLETFGTAKNAWEASPVDLKEVLKDTLSSQFETFRKNFSIESYEKQLQAKNVSFLILSDSEYPKLLAVIPNPPFVLYIKGNKSILADTMIGIVGTRKVTSYGREVTEMFAGELTQTGFTIVSGLAMGVDAIAHKATLENDGKTVAVLGCGVDCCFPVENQRLYDAILEKDGVIVSEYPIGTTPNKGTFPSRNRIIAGLSQGVLVTEGAEDSG